MPPTMWERPPGLDNQGQETFPTDKHNMEIQLSISTVLVSNVLYCFRVFDSDFKYFCLDLSRT